MVSIARTLRLVVCLLPSPTSTSDLQPDWNKVDHEEYEMSVGTKIQCHNMIKNILLVSYRENFFLRLLWCRCLKRSVTNNHLEKNNAYGPPVT